jgi:hypothetical protein
MGGNSCAARSKYRDLQRLRAVQRTRRLAGLDGACQRPHDQSALTRINDSDLAAGWPRGNETLHPFCKLMATCQQQPALLHF